MPNHTTYIGIRNFHSPCGVNVKFKEIGKSYYDSDTLHIMHLNEYIYDTFLLRNNTGRDSYSFVAPSNREIGLRPMSFGQPIYQIQIFKTKDSTLTIDFDNEKTLKKLEKEGVIKFNNKRAYTSIYINIR